MPNAPKDPLAKLLQSNQLEPYIRHIRFPTFKNIEPGTRIDLDYPITALVGPNGTNKSSILRAIQGSPEQSNLGNYWFSTAIDPIEENKDGPHCFIYGYLNAAESKIVEVLKTRIRNASDPDYWEPSRAIIKYEMERFNPTVVGSSQNTTRWDNVSKNVVYIDFRQSISAFDKFFYQGELGSLRDRKGHIRNVSPHLLAAIDSKSDSYKYYIERIINRENRDLNTDEVEAVSKILNRSYSDISLIRHSFFKCDAYTSILKTATLKYTEAFAGSGEFAVVRLVSEIYNAPERSLLLLDEPEVSLHPGAQENLMKFLISEIKRKKHQVVISTHSPSIIRNLPRESIKVLAYDPTLNLVRLTSQQSSPEEAFFHLGEPTQGKRTLIVEDSLAQAIVMKALRKGGEAFASQFEVTFYGGGASTLWAYYIPIFSAMKRKDVTILFDGDTAPNVPLPDPAHISEADEGELEEALKAVSGTTIKFHVDGGVGGHDAKQESKRRRELVQWARSHVRYLPGGIPEQFVWDNMEKTEDMLKVENITPIKDRFIELTRMEMGLEKFEKIKSEDIAATMVRRVARIPSSNNDINKLYSNLVEIMSD